MKEILFLTYGDANNANVWSNVPYCFSHSLENKGIVVHRVDYSMNPTITKLYNLVLRRILDGITFRKLRFPYLRTTRLFKFYAERKIKKAILQYPRADLCLFMGYGFYNKWNDVPSLLFSDWTTEMDIRKNRKPNFLEKRIILQEEEAINHAQYVISLFPVCCEEMKRKYPKANIHFLGGNVINDLLNKSLVSRSTFQVSNNNADNTIIVEDLIEKKSKSKKLLFIGRKTTYLEAAKKLIEAYKLLKEEEDYKDLSLDIVGCTTSDFDSLPNGVTCYGFLNKSEEKYRRTYYDLLLNAKVLVNANPKWGAFSSTVEAMYYYTPVIVSPYQDFVENFGEKIDFGVYNQDFTAESLSNDIKSVINSDNYAEMCNFAHESVKTYTWENFVEKIMELIK
jgi:glycosyltransferase involved in cell wall biosynthesis